MQVLSHYWLMRWHHTPIFTRQTFCIRLFAVAFLGHLFNFIPATSWDIHFTERRGMEGQVNPGQQPENPTSTEIELRSRRDLSTAVYHFVPHEAHYISNISAILAHLPLLKLSFLLYGYTPQQSLFRPNPSPRLRRNPTTGASHNHTHQTVVACHNFSLLQGKLFPRSISTSESTAKLCTTNQESINSQNLRAKPAKARASSVGTALRWRKSLLFPTSMMTILLSAWSRSSFSQRSTFSYVRCLAMS